MAPYSTGSLSLSGVIKPLARVQPCAALFLQIDLHPGRKAQAKQPRKKKSIMEVILKRKGQRGPGPPKALARGFFHPDLYFARTRARVS